MSSHTTDAEQDSQETDPYAPEVLRQLVPSRLGDKGQRAAICAIRNPDASSVQIAEKCGLASSYSVGNALRSLLLDPDQDYGASSDQVHERRGGQRDAQAYDELTDKQQAIIDFAARHGQFVEDHTYGEIAQAIDEKEGVPVGETYVGTTLRKYQGLLHRRRAQVASEGEAEQDLEAATQDMTVREMLEAAGYDLPDENLDSMPEVEVDIPTDEDRQATLGEAQEAEATFEQASERERSREEREAEQDEGDEGEDEDGLPERAHDWLGEDWRDAHFTMPGADRAQRLPDEADDEDVKQNTPYWAYVNGVTSYGVFVSLTKPPYGDDVSGLVKEERLHGAPSHYERGDAIIVELDHRNARGLAFTDYRHAHPDEDGRQEAEDEADSEQEDEAEGEVLEYEDPAQDGEQRDVGEVQAAGDGGPEYGGLEGRTAWRVEQVAERVEALEQAVDTLREDSVMASEVAEFAQEVEDRLDEVAETQEVATETAEALGERLERVENAQSGTVEAALEKAEAEAEAREELEQRLDTLQQMVNGLGQQVEQATAVGGTLGRVQEDVQRLQGEGATVASYSYQRQDGTVTLHLQASLPEAEAEDETVPECAACGAPLGETWQERQEAAREDGSHPADCPQCGENPLPPVGSSPENDGESNE